ncbi:hypothetical protein FXB41_25805 [Bradyrhizobium canariense]|uniref:hypothetical protein n=1 Tax=Bradyrhizobium canariense TaxID=255045 RepID=UPI001CA4D5B1|nr:hypothetical protein [Bradyrhizobium canariense]MBW5438049.1 hypothetical protein [Bradyrhizobium canariense]
MFSAFVATASTFAMVGPLQILGAVSAILAVAMFAIAILIPAPALTQLARLLRPVFIITLAAPALWMILQVIPIPVREFGNPIWATAAAALNEPLAARLTVDVHATMLSLAQYIAVIAAALITALVALDRERAAHFLYVFTSIGAFVSAFLVSRAISSFAITSAGEQSRTQTNGSVAAVLGALLAAGIAIRAADQLLRRPQPRRSAVGAIITLTGAILSLAVCTAAILASSDAAIAVATLIGAGTLVAVYSIRKWFFGVWGTAGVLATAAVILLASYTVIPIKRDTDVLIALSTQNQTATERMLQDTGPTGSGAGAFQALLPIYRDIGMSAMRERPTVAAAIAVGMGRPFLYGLMAVFMLVAFILFKRSLSRRSDYIYAAVGAATSVSLPILALAEGGATDLASSFLVAALYGMAFAQSLPSAPHNAGSLHARELSDRLPDRSVKDWQALTIFGEGIWTRAALVSIGVVLATQTAWILSNRWHFGGAFPIEATSTSDASRGKKSEAMSIGCSGWKFAQLKTPEAANSSWHCSASASQIFADALRYSPLRGDLWLMLAAMSKEYKSTGYDVVALLKLSYYTAPNDLDLLPLRLSIALGTSAAVSEPELRDLIKRDVKIALTTRPGLKPAITAAYQSASVDGKAFADNLISELDPGYLQSMRVRRP